MFWTISPTRIGLLIWYRAYFPLYIFLGPFRGAQMPQNSIKKNYFLVVSDYLSYQNGTIDLVWGLFSSLDIGTNNLPFAGL
jgi:hypothetical protein